MTTPAVLVPLRPVARPWGGDGVVALGLRAPPGAAIGEWWVDAPGFPLLVKVIDTRAPLSIQLHPDDDAARALGHRSGKTEAWCVLFARAGASVGLGLASGRDSGAFLAAAERGEDVSGWLVNLPVAAGDAVFVPPGTVHTIGAGITILEVQEPSDVTLRVFDWNREPKRELHVAAARRAIRTGGAAGVVHPHAVGAGDRLAARHDVVVECDRFRVERVEADRPFRVTARRSELWFCAEGHARVSPDVAVDAGGALLVAPATSIEFSPFPRALLYRILPP